MFCETIDVLLNRKKMTIKDANFFMAEYLVSNGQSYVAFKDLVNRFLIESDKTML